MIIILLKTIWLIIPAGFANIAPVLFRSINFLSYPIDFKSTYKGKVILGENKTFRGFFFGILFAIIAIKIQVMLYPYAEEISVIDYGGENIYKIGFLLGFGALIGDVTKSFFKRRIGIKPGDSWIPFDQIDWIIGSLLMLQICIPLQTIYITTSIVLFGLLHPIFNFISYKFGFQKNKL